MEKLGPKEDQVLTQSQRETSSLHCQSWFWERQDRVKSFWESTGPASHFTFTFALLRACKVGSTDNEHTQTSHLAGYCPLGMSRHSQWAATGYFLAHPTLQMVLDWVGPLIYP